MLTNARSVAASLVINLFLAIRCFLTGSPRRVSNAHHVVVATAPTACRRIQMELIDANAVIPRLLLTTNVGQRWGIVNKKLLREVKSE